MRKLFLAALLLSLSRPVMADDLSGTSCPGAGCADFNVGGQGSIGIQVT